MTCERPALVPIRLGTSGATQPDEVYLAKLQVSHTLRPAEPWNSLSWAVNRLLVFWIVSAGFEIALSARVQSRRPRSNCPKRYIIFGAFGLRSETEVHTGKQWQANSKTFISTFPSEEAAVWRSQVLIAERLHVHRPVNFHLQILWPSCKKK